MYFGVADTVPDHQSKKKELCKVSSDIIESSYFYELFKTLNYKIVFRLWHYAVVTQRCSCCGTRSPDIKSVANIFINYRGKGISEISSVGCQSFCD